MLHRLLLVNGFCFYDIMHLSIAAPGNPLEFDTFNFSGVFRILTSCLCLCVAWAFAAQEMTKLNIRTIEISRNLRKSFFAFCVLDASDALALRHRRQRRRRHIKATKYRAFSRLDRTVLSGTWFGLDWGKMQIADFTRIKHGKVMRERCIQAIFLMDKKGRV